MSRVARECADGAPQLGHVSANAGIDRATCAPPAAAAGGTGPWVLRLPADPDASRTSAARALAAAFGVNVGVVISDSFGRPFRLGTVGVAIGVAGFPPLWDQRGRRDLYGRVLEATLTAPADQLAGALRPGRRPSRRSARRCARARPAHFAGAPSRRARRLPTRPQETSTCEPSARVVYLSGGVGGARLAYGMARALPPTALTIVVNTGDDFAHWGLASAPTSTP